MVATLKPKSRAGIAIPAGIVSGNRIDDKINCLLCASRSGAASGEESARQIVRKPGKRKQAEVPSVSAIVGNAIAIRHKVVIFGTADRAEAARRLARLYFRIWPGLPLDVEWLEAAR